MKNIVFILLITHCSLLIVKAQQPTQQWVKRFSGNGFASGLSVKLDSSGNVYVLMKLYTDSTFNDYGLVKYSNSGNLLWNRYYNSPGNLGDDPAAFDVTVAGDVYITGSSGINFAYQILTVKFNSSGVLQWAKTMPPISYGVDLKIDKDGNVIVVSAGSRIIKYNPDGDTQWTRNINIGTRGDYLYKVITDDSSNVYATGYTRPDSLRTHFLTLKYNTNGSLMWYSTYYNDPGYQVDFATCIAIDTNRNVYVAGQSHTLTPGYDNNSLLKISPNGIIQWARIYKGIGGNNGVRQPADIAVIPDGSGIYYTTFCANGMGGGASDIVTLKYNSAGDSVWVRRYGGGVFGTANQPAEIKLDKYLDVYVTGMAHYSTSGDDCVTIKYLSSGVQQWVATYNGPVANSFDYAHGLVIDTSLNVYVTGISSRQNNPILWDAITIKYNQIIGIISNSNELPVVFKLFQNYPNPFNSTTVITYALPIRSKVKLTIYTITGQFVKTLVNEVKEPGFYTVQFDGTSLASGVYFYTIEAGEYKASKKMVLVK